MSLIIWIFKLAIASMIIAFGVLFIINICEIIREDNEFLKIYGDKFIDEIKNK